MIKSILLLLTVCCLSFSVHAQYWQQQANYIIDVTLNDTAHTLDGFEKITYTNNSPDTLGFIWFHLWPNAYKNDKTAFSEQLLSHNRTDFYFSNKDQRGYINRLDFKVDGITAKTEDHPYYIDIVKLVLPVPLLPGSHITISTPFHIQLPDNFSRGGHTGQSYQVTQWYPKPAVYDRTGWHQMPYLDQGEFYSEFGDYDVRISIPGNYVVAATGELQNEEEKEWLKTRSNFTWQPVVSRVTTRKGSTHYTKKIVQAYPVSSSIMKTLQYKQGNVHDFAWFADKRFVVKQDTLLLPSGNIVNAFSYYLPNKATVWTNSISFIKKAIRFRSSLIGAYPYRNISVVEAKMGIDGGMEYPTITNISEPGTSAELELVIEHEVGHNWLQGMLASNERQYPWMDEGFNTYYDNRYNRTAVKNIAVVDNNIFRHRIPENPEHVLLESMIAIKKDQPINTASEDFTEANYGFVAYVKTGEWMELLEKQLGTVVFDSCMHEYFRRWQFKHPYPEDFKKLVAEISGRNTDDIFKLLDEKGDLQPVAAKKQIKPTAFFNLTNTDKYHYINILPAIGYNQYDKLMVGAIIHNYSLPSTKFQFLLAPLYATGSSQFNYLARASYSWYPDNFLYKAEIGAAVASFSTDEYQPADKDKIILGFRKFAPYIRLTLKEKNPLSKIKRYVQFKTFFINEDALNFRSIITPTDTTNVVEKKSSNRYLNQLKLVIENNRVLYPYRAELQAEQGEGFIRLAFTGNYFLNYSSNKGGVDIRLFAGKFLYTNREKANPFLYGLNMSAPKGKLDYTYSDYFIGRNDYPFRTDGIKWTLPYQQVMIRDGAFKVNTDGQGDTGTSDDWLVAANASFDIPASINPFSVLPVKIPLKLFADVGTYKQAWQKNAPTDRFLYDAGIQISLLKQLLNIYIPILYSQPYKDYYKTDFFSGGKNRFLKTISFSIDISKMKPQKFIKELSF